MSPRAHLLLLLCLVLPLLSLHMAEGQTGAPESVSGRVTDQRGEPIEGAEVWVYLDPTDDFTAIREGRKPPRREPLHTRTGPDGRFRVEGLERGKRYEVGAKHAGFVDASLPGVQAPTVEPLKIEMAVARSLSGQVVGPEGEPVAGASVAWAREVRTSYTMGLIYSSGSIGGSQRLGTTGADGRFRVSGPPPGPVTLDVIAEGYAPRRIEGLQLPEDKDLKDVKITLLHGNTLDIRVLNAEGEPVPDAWVYAEPEDPGFRPESPPFQSLDADTDSEGRCRLTVPEAGVYMVGASEAGSAIVEQRVVVGPGTTRIELRLQPSQGPESPPERSEGEKPVLASRLQNLFSEERSRKGFTLTGRILVDGKPLSRGEVDVHGESTVFGPSYVAHDGTFTIQGMPAGTSILMITDPNGFVGAPTVTVTQDQTVSIELSTGRLRGQVTAGTGTPVEDAAVTVNAWIPAIKGTISASGGRTGPDGSFEIPGLGAGTYKVKISKEGFSPFETTATVPPGGSAPPLVVALKLKEGAP